jgi:hypothetical protein
MAWLELHRHRPLDPRELEPFGVDEQFAKSLQRAGHLGPLKRKNPLAWWLHQRREHGLAALGVTYASSRPDDLRYLLELGYGTSVATDGPGPFRALVDYHTWEYFEARQQQTWYEWKTFVHAEADETAWTEAWTAHAVTLTRPVAPMPPAPPVAPVAAPIPSDVPTATLYRFFDADDNLLYIGQSIKAYERVQRHAKDKTWFPDAATVTFQRVPAVDVLRLEAEAIRTERPRYNITHRTDQP